MIELLRRIESLEYQIQFAIFSGIDDFIEAINASAEYAQLLEVLSNSRNARTVYFRIRNLIKESAGSALRSRYDTAIAMYLVAFEARAATLLSLVTRYVFAHPENLWWAMRTAERIRRSHPHFVVHAEPVDEFIALDQQSNDSVFLVRSHPSTLNSPTRVLTHAAGRQAVRRTVIQFNDDPPSSKANNFEMGLIAC